MSDAINHPVKRQYNRKEVHTGEMQLPDDKEVDLGDGFQRGGESIQLVDKISDDYAAELAFNEELVTIRIDDNSRSEIPLTHVPCWVNGRGAEVMVDGKWCAVGWLEVGTPITTKRKYVEGLIRSKPEVVRTMHEDATVANPNNRMIIKAGVGHPLTIINDTPKGHAWATRIMREG